MAELLLRLREREVSRTPIATTRVTLGRDPSCDVVIDNAAVSRVHATLIYVDKQFRIRDGSANGMTVNGRSVKDAVLSYDDVIGIGKFELVLRKTEGEELLQAGTPPRPQKPTSVEVTIRPAAPRASQTELPAEAVAAANPEAPAAPTKRIRKITDTDVDWTTVVKIAGAVLVTVVAALAGAIWALTNGLINLNL